MRPDISLPLSTALQQSCSPGQRCTLVGIAQRQCQIDQMRAVLLGVGDRSAPSPPAAPSCWNAWRNGWHGHASLQEQWDLADMEHTVWQNLSQYLPRLAPTASQLLDCPPSNLQISVVQAAEEVQHVAIGA